MSDVYIQHFCICVNKYYVFVKLFSPASILQSPFRVETHDRASLLKIKYQTNFITYTSIFNIISCMTKHIKCFIFIFGIFIALYIYRGHHQDIASLDILSR